MQKVEMYYSVESAKSSMTEYIKIGWKILSCSIAAYTESDIPTEKVLVVYEK